jgi:type III restriction enzyme
MAYVVDRVVICDAFREPDKHYQLLSGGKSKLAQGRRPSVRFLASARDVKGGIAGVVGKEASLFEDMLASSEQQNDFVNQLRGEVRAWREDAYTGTAMVTRRLLEWWFERDEERTNMKKRFFFCQQEAIETVIYLFEVQKRRRMPETGDLVRYALKLATGTGKTVVMAMLVTWSTLHKRKVSGSSLSENFLVLVPNLTVRDRVSGVPRGDGLAHSGEHNLYDAFDMVPPEYHDEFHPNVVVRNWQGIPLEGKRDDWIPEGVLEEGRFIPAAVLRAMRRRAQQDPNAVIRRMLGGWRDLVVINDEAHHVYGEKRTRKGEDPGHIRWSKILQRVSTRTRSASDSTTPTAHERTFGTRTLNFSFFASGSIHTGFLPHSPVLGRFRFSTGNPTNGMPKASTVSSDPSGRSSRSCLRFASTRGRRRLTCMSGQWSAASPRRS